MVTSVLLVVQPSVALFERMQKHFATKRGGRSSQQNYDMDIINLELSCQDEVLVLPKHYGTIDSEYNEREGLHDKVKECQNFDDVHFLHFTSGGKPWTRNKVSAKRHYTMNFERKVAKKFEEWFQLAHDICPSLISITL